MTAVAAHEEIQGRKSSMVRAYGRPHDGQAADDRLQGLQEICAQASPRGDSKLWIIWKIGHVLDWSSPHLNRTQSH